MILMLFKSTFLTFLLYVSLTLIHHASQAKDKSANDTENEAAHKTRTNEVGHPTVRPVQPYTDSEVSEDAAKLKEILGEESIFDANEMISILTHRVYDQRQLIAIKYKEVTGKELEKRLKEKLKNEPNLEFKYMLLALLNPYDFIADILKAAFLDYGTNQSDLSHIICTATNAQMKLIKQAYEIKFDVLLATKFGLHTYGYFKDFLAALIQTERDENPYYNVNDAMDVIKADAAALHQAVELQTGTNMSHFFHILSNRNIYHLQQVFIEYKMLFNNDFEKDVEIKFKRNSITKVLPLFVQFVNDKYAYFATRLYESMTGVQTLKKHKDFIRIFVTRCEIDMGNILLAFSNLYKTNLVVFIQENITIEYPENQKNTSNTLKTFLPYHKNTIFTTNKYRECLIELIMT